MSFTIEWLGCATFRLTIDDLVVFLDAYLDRPPAAPPVGLSAKDVARADVVLVGHSHFDHLAGAEVIAANTGARIIASNESCRVLRDAGVPREQLLPSAGGERHRLAPDITVRVFPSLHACTWCPEASVGETCAGDLGLDEDQRRASMLERGLIGRIARAESERARQFAEHARAATGSPRDGGPLVYLIETPRGAIFYQDTTGCWSGVLQQLRADVAIFALSARPNLDGEPFQGSIADFVAQEAAWLQPATVLFCHHDNWSGLEDADLLDVSPARQALARALPRARLLEPWYLETTPIL